MRTGFMGHKRAAFLAMTAAATLAVAGTVAGLAGPAGASSAARGGAAAITGTEHLQIMTTSATATTASTIAYGVFTAAGADHQGNTVDTIVFPGGSVKVKHSPGTGPQSFNPKTCLFTVNQHGTYSFSGGTGKYKGISGHGKYTISIVGLGAKVKGTCSQTLPPVAFQQVIDASGTVKLP
jgi:hypothetical protein